MRALQKRYGRKALSNMTQKELEDEFVRVSKLIPVNRPLFDDPRIKRIMKTLDVKFYYRPLKPSRISKRK